MAKKHKGLSMVHLNVRSLYEHIDEIRLSFTNYDVITFTETWLTDKLPNSMLSVEDYSLLRQDRKGAHVKERGGGIAVYLTRKLMNCASCDPNLSTCTHDLEQMWIKLDIQHMKLIWLCVCYRPPSGKVRLAFEQLYNSTKLAGNVIRKHELVVMGDFNINYKKTSSPDYKFLKEYERQFMLVQLINQPTRISNELKSTLDLI